VAFYASCFIVSSQKIEIEKSVKVKHRKELEKQLNQRAESLTHSNSICKFTKGEEKQLYA